MSRSVFAQIPKVDDLLNQAEALIGAHGRGPVTDQIRIEIDSIRESLKQDQNFSVPTRDQILDGVKQTLQDVERPSLRPVLNLSGTVLHTNLGRARLPESALDAMRKVGLQYSNLEFDLEEGQRGDRDVHIEQLIQKITGAEAATVVNNNAAAVMIALSALAAGKEVPVSRGELVEIGGSFRIPDIMSQSGCRLREIGTTNRTHAKDYVNAINETTGVLMKVHTSNYEINGFTKAVSDAEVATIAYEHDLPFITDLGSGTLVDLRKWGLPYETTVQDSLKAGADIVTFSGDKLLGGPQCGLIVGRRDLIAKIKQHPLKRALRLDKLTIAALTEVLRLYLNPDQLTVHIPALRDLAKPVEAIEVLANEVLSRIKLPGFNVKIIEVESQIGSGALPTSSVPSIGIAIESKDGSGSKIIALEQACRMLPIPVLGRLHDGALKFDLRTLDDANSLIEQLDQLVL